MEELSQDIENESAESGQDGGEAEGNHLLSLNELDTPRMRAEKLLVRELDRAALTLRSVMTVDPMSFAAGKDENMSACASVLKTKLTAALEVFDRVHAITSVAKPAAISGSDKSVSLSAAAYRKVLAKRMLKAKVIEMQPIAAEEKASVEKEAQPSAAVPSAIGLGVIPRG